MLSVGCLGFGVGVAGAAISPSGRGYELVSPRDKNGANIGVHSSRTRSAASGNAVQFESLGTFADIVGTGIGAEYVSRRVGGAGSQGWMTHGITPSQEPLSLVELIGSVEPRYQGDFSADLARGVFFAHSPLVADGPNVEAISALYLRDGLLDPGAMSSVLVTDCLSPPAGPCASPLTGPAQEQPGYAGASEDFGH